MDIYFGNQEIEPMPEKIYKITLANGTVIDNLRLNGNNFISETEVTKEMFEHNLGSVLIEDGETVEEHGNMDLVQIMKYNDEWWFVLRDISEAELREAKLRSDLDYLAMMTDIEF